MISPENKVIRYRWFNFYVSIWYVLIAVFMLSFSSGEIYAQDSWWKNKKFKNQEKQKKYENCKLAYINISDGLMYSNVNYIIPFFQNEVYLSINDTEKGYYNREQTAFIVESFLNSNPVSSFKWKNSSVAENYAFAIGKYKYKKSGFINTYTISVSLKYINELWLIDQVIVN